MTHGRWTTALAIALTKIASHQQRGPVPLAGGEETLSKVALAARRSRGRVVGFSVAAAVIIAAAASANAPGVPKTACDVPAGEPAPGTAEFAERDVQNQLCAGQKVYTDQFTPSYATKADSEIPSDYSHTMIHQVDSGEFGPAGGPVAVPVWVDIPGATTADPYRMPDEWAAGGRGNTVGFYFNKCDGTRLAARLFWPNEAFSGPMPAAGWPGIAISTGSVQAFKEIYYWSGEGLAEAGYMVIMYDVNGQGQSDTNANATYALPASQCTDASQFTGSLNDALDFLESGPGNPRPSPNPGTLAYNPRRALLDVSRIGIAGHSAGAAAVSTVGQQRADVKALVAWDCLSNLGTAPAQPYHAAALGVCSEYLFNQTANLTAPPTTTKLAGFESIRAWDLANPDQAIDTMLVFPRSSTHLEYDYVPYTFPSSRYGERVAFHYTLAWLDRYVKGIGNPALQADALARLTATRFDGSADASSIGAGTYDAATNANVPYRIAGDCTSNRLSFYFNSRYTIGGVYDADMQHDEPNTDPSTYCGAPTPGAPPL